MSADTWNFAYSEDQYNKFRAGELWAEWARQYPEIFDADDVRIAQTQAVRGTIFLNG